MMKRGRFRRGFSGAILAFAAVGCASGGGITYEPLPADQARLIFADRTLDGADRRFRAAKRTAAGHRIERGHWDGRRGERAALMLIESMPGKGINAPEDPRDLVGDFSGLVKLNAAFGDLYESETAAGPAVWRRFVAGDRSCVIFTQRWDNGAGSAPVRVLSGYYCAKPGDSYTVDDAQATLRTIDVKPTQPATTPKTDRKRS